MVSFQNQSETTYIASYLRNAMPSANVIAGSALLYVSVASRRMVVHFSGNSFDGLTVTYDYTHFRNPVHMIDQIDFHIRRYLAVHVLLVNLEPPRE